MNLPNIQLPEESKNLLMNFIKYNQNGENINKLYKILNIPQGMIIEQPKMDVEEYFTTIWDQLQMIDQPNQDVININFEDLSR